VRRVLEFSGGGSSRAAAHTIHHTQRIDRRAVTPINGQRRKRLLTAAKFKGIQWIVESRIDQ